MEPEHITIISDHSASNLYRRICQIAGAEIPTGGRGPGEQLVPEGYECSNRPARLLREALAKPDAPIWVFRGTAGELLVAYSLTGSAALTLKTYDDNAVFQGYSAPIDTTTPTPDSWLTERAPE